MKKNSLIIALATVAFSVSAQTTIPNGGFEDWGNVSPGNGDEPTTWYSNKTGSSTAQTGPQTAFKETNDPYSGSSCVRIETKDLIIAKVNGNLTTGIINAPSTDKSRGYVGTINYSTPSDERRVPFVGRPDSLVGWFKYTSGGTSNGIPEMGKIVAILHTGHYYDPEVPVAANVGVYPDVSANRIGKALFNTPTNNTTSWTRFSVPFEYVSGANPEYIMISITSSDNQMTNKAGSKLWLDDLEVIYNPETPAECDGPSNLVVTQNTNSVDLSWTAATTVPVGGYGYAIISADSSQSPIPFHNTTDTFKTGITGTQAQFSETLVAGRTYNAYIVSFCGPSADPAVINTSSTVMKTFVFTGVVGVNETTANEFQVYAFNKQLHIDLTDLTENNAVLTILDLTGKEVFKTKLNGNEKNIITTPSSIGTGVYFYNVEGGNIQKSGKISL